MGSLGPFSWLRYFIHYHHRSTCSRRIQEALKGGRGESERAREKEMKRRRERGQGAVDSSHRQCQDNCSKDLSWFKVDIPQMGQTSTRVRESSLLPGLTPKMCPLQSLLPTGNRFESLGMVPIPSPMAGGENGLKDIP